MKRHLSNTSGVGGLVLASVALLLALGPGSAALAAQERADSVAPDLASSELRQGPEIHAGDLLQIRIWPDRELGGEFPVENTGYVYLPILGEVWAAGLTLEELRTELRSRYSEGMRNPIVSVDVTFRVSVVGAVFRPGLYTANPTFTVFDVISEAGGFRENAETDQLRLIRNGEIFRLDAEETLRTGGGRMGLMVRSGDRIVVPADSFSARDLLTILQSAAILATLISVL